MFIFVHSTVSDRLPRFITQKIGFKTGEYPPLTSCDVTVGQLALERVELSAGVQSIWLQNIQVYTLVTWSRHCLVVHKW